MIGFWSSIICENSHTPPANEPDDAEHYDALNATGFFGAQGAGCIPMSRITGRILVGLRSGAVEQPGTWGGFGGAHKSNEQPIDAAMRELHEETGYAGKAQMVPLFVFSSGTFTYHNFLALVEDEFVPDLGWEADAHKWCSLDDLPYPLHFGMEAVLNDPKSYGIITKYMKELR